MLEYELGKNIMDSEAQCIVNTVNCEGVMGKGLAYSFKKAYERNFNEYEKACKDGRLKIGEILPYEEEGKIIINFPTKNKWREKSRIEYIVTGLDKLAEYIVEKGIKSIAIPPLGCGNGGLEWSKVKGIIEDKLGSIEGCVITLYEPSGEIRKYINKDNLCLLKTMRLLDKDDEKRVQCASGFLFSEGLTDRYEPNNYSRGYYSNKAKADYDTIEKCITEFKIDKKELYNQMYGVFVSKDFDKDKDIIKKIANMINATEDEEILECMVMIRVKEKREIPVPSDYPEAVKEKAMENLKKLDDQDQLSFF